MTPKIRFHPPRLHLSIPDLRSQEFVGPLAQPTKKSTGKAGLELPTSGIRDRRRYHWAITTSAGPTLSEHPRLT